MIVDVLSDLGGNVDEVGVLGLDDGNYRVVGMDPVRLERDLGCSSL